MKYNSFAKIMQEMREAQDRNTFTPAQAIEVIENARKNFLKANEEFGYTTTHVCNVLANYDTDIAAINAGKRISIVKYTWQGASIA